MQTQPLDGLLILCPSGRGLSYATETSLDALTAAGAEKLRSHGNSDVTMHRCQIAQRALDEKLLRYPDRYSAVFWLDADMEASISQVRELMDLVSLIAECRPQPEDAKPLTDMDELKCWQRSMAPALSGAYVKRNDPLVMAARHVTPKVPPLKVSLDRGDSNLRKYELPAIVAGMGCLMQTQEAFVAHCREAVTIENYGQDQFPAICASGPGTGGDGNPAWASEDWTYTSWEWARGRGVYLVRHALFGHERTTVEYPTPETRIDD